MFVRIAQGELPAKPHTVLQSAAGQLRYEECLTREGFDGPFSILYHVDRPQAFSREDSELVYPLPETSTADGAPLRRRHLATSALRRSGDSISARTPLLFNQDVVVSLVTPEKDDAQYFSNADADELLFIHAGGGALISPFGALRFEAGDYVLVPKSVPHRFEVSGAQHWLSLELTSELGPLAQYRNRAGQLRMDAPYSHRDFRLPVFRGPQECDLRQLLVKRGTTSSALGFTHSLLDVVGFDGCIYPWAFPILAFQPRVGSVHLPPTVHGTFAANGVLVCSFVPRPVDFGKEAIPCPYPHSSVDVDEVLFYSRGDFTSRTGVGPGSLSLHPRGIPHGPQPGRYEASIGTTRTEELAVMLDCVQPLRVAKQALVAEQSGYDESFSV